MKSLTPIITYDCNLNCSFCILRDGEKCATVPERLLESVERYCIKNPGAMLHIMGGEPLLRPDLMNSVASIGKRNQMKVTIYTNGTLWTEQHSKWANVNDIAAVFSVHSISGEKPLRVLNIPAIKALKGKSFTKVVEPGERWAELVWLLYNLFDCKINVTMDVHTMGNLNVKDFMVFIQEYEKLGRPDWVDIVGMTTEKCNCAGHGMIEPDGSFKTRAAYLKVRVEATEGCLRIEKSMGKEKYDLIRKLLGVM